MLYRSVVTGTAAQRRNTNSLLEADEEEKKSHRESLNDKSIRNESETFEDDEGRFLSIGQ